MDEERPLARPQSAPQGRAAMAGGEGERRRSAALASSLPPGLLLRGREVGARVSRERPSSRAALLRDAELEDSVPLSARSNGQVENVAEVMRGLLSPPRAGDDSGLGLGDQSMDSSGVYDDGDDGAEDDDDDDEIPMLLTPFDGVSIMCYNVLAGCYAHASRYPYVAGEVLDVDVRRQGMVEKVLDAQADVVCMQEVEPETQEVLDEAVGELYESCYFLNGRLKEGCLVMFRTDRFRRMRKESIDIGDNGIAVVVTLEHKHRAEQGAPALLHVATTHLHGHPANPHIRLRQVCTIFDYLEPEQARNEPIVVCGDFNAGHNSGLYRFIQRGGLPPNTRDARKGNPYSEGAVAHTMQLESAYYRHRREEPAFTIFTDRIRKVVDYIWFSRRTLGVVDTLPMIAVDDQDMLEPGIPSIVQPSDHLPIAAAFRFLGRNST